MSSGGSSSSKPVTEKQESKGQPSNAPKVGVRERVKHFTWAWFLSTMSTGGLSIALAETPHKFRGKSEHARGWERRLTQTQDYTLSVL
jgi:hypothetical protein